MIRTPLTTLLCTALLANPSSGNDHGHEHDHSPEVQFHLNKGQWPGVVLYQAKTPGGVVFVERDGFTHVLRKGGPLATHGKPGAEEEPLRMHAYKMHFEGAQAASHGGSSKQRHYANYFLGNDEAQWASEVPIYGGVELNELYPGIGMRISGGHGLKYDWLIDAGADPALITIRFEGQDALVAEHGVLRIATTAGDVVEQRPVAWQLVHGRQRHLDVAYVLKGDRVSYTFPNGYDERYPIVIDPVVEFCTYAGSSADNFGTTATYDEQGHLYGAGTVFNIGYPVTTGVLQPTFGGPTLSGTDMAVTKFSPDGTALIWSTYIGGSANEVPHSMVTNGDSELYILGTTSSSNFPVTSGCFDNSYGGGTTPPFVGSYGFTYTGSDIVVVHLNLGATALIGSTFVGGSGNDGLNQTVPLLRNYGDPFRGEIIMDAQDRPLVATTTISTDMTTTADAPQPTSGGLLDAYIFRMDPTLSTMLWATYYGGSGNDNGLGVQISSNGDVYMTGGTQSANLTMAGTPFINAAQGGVDGYIVRYDPSGAQLLSTTYLGTTAFDQSYFVQLDSDDEVYVVGQTAGAYPVSSGVYANANASQFIHKLSSDLSTSLWSTRIGGTGNENISPSAFLVSVCDQIYFSGWGGSTNSAGGGVTQSSTIGLPVSADAHQPTTDGSDFYLIVLDPEASAMAYATFFGGSSAEHVDGGTSRFDKDGIVYQAVCAGCSGSFPTTPGAWSSTDMGVNCNLGVFKINFEQGVQASIDVDATDQTACLEEPVVFNAVGNAVVYTWDFGDGSAPEQGVTVAHIYAEPGEYQVMLVGSDDGSCNQNDTAYANITIIAPAVLDARFEAVPNSDCNGYSAEFFNLSTGSTVFFWEFGDGTTSTQTNPVHPYSAPGTYTVVLAVLDPLCPDTARISAPVVIEPASLEYTPNSPLALCNGEDVVADAGAGFDSYSWSTGSTQQLLTVTVPGVYGITVTEGFCVGEGEVVVEATPQHPPMEDVTTCDQASIELVPTFTPAEILWNTGATTPTITVNEQGIYSFQAIDLLGCPASDEVSVVIAPAGQGQAVVPNVFTPNGDGKNDTFLVQGLAIDRFNMEILDRWGMTMFETSNVNTGWNGGLDNQRSDAAPDGTYYYIIEITDRCASKPTDTLKGHVTLLR